MLKSSVRSLVRSLRRVLRIVPSQGSVLAAYSFLTVSLMFGLPLLVSYYVIQQNLGFASTVIASYLLFSAAVGFGILARFRRSSKGTINSVRPEPGHSRSAIYGLAALLVSSAGVILLAEMKYSIARSYPIPSQLASQIAGPYLLCVALASSLGFPALVTSAFRVVRETLSEKRMRVVAVTVGIVYFVIYEIMVNEIVITGYNVPPGNFVAPPSGYPWVYIFTSGPSPSNILETIVYVPYVLIQVSELVSFIVQPFEIIFAVLISTLVAANVSAAIYTMKRSDRINRACSAGAAFSGVGAFIGYTATCPSCLAPTLISVVFGGFASVQAVFSNVYGAVLPPLVSVAALVLSLIALNRSLRK